MQERRGTPSPDYSANKLDSWKVGKEKIKPGKADHYSHFHCLMVPALQVLAWGSNYPIVISHFRIGGRVGECF